MIDIRRMVLKSLADRTRDKVLRKVRKYRVHVKDRPVVLESRGVCPICERKSTFVARDPWLRDSFKCKRCGSIPRERALMWVLTQRFPRWREMTVHESSPNRGASRRLATQCPGYVPTQFFPDRAPGSVAGDFRCENLEQLTFPDESIDLHITQDVFEHIPRPEMAITEIARTLKVGGAHVFTVPLVNKDAPTQMRVKVKESGDVLHLLPPEYHRNPIDATGSLVTVDWGYDIREIIMDTCGLPTEIIQIDDLTMGLRAEYLEVLITTKERATH